MLRVKCTLGAKKKSFRVFGPDRKEMTLDEVRAIDWRNTKFGAIAKIKSCFFQASSFGPVLELEALLVEEKMPNALSRRNTSINRFVTYG